MKDIQILLDMCKYFRFACSKLAAEASVKQGAHNKALYDGKEGASGLDVNNKVLVRQTHFDGKHKLADRWEPHTYTVVEIPNRYTCI
ncbi:hypothetical protein DPMN_152283 [Dreissena polymorpha]|uniref:Uncharacterized protein n=1 Tax=Dreissena polymorpha TaxID=45954 RepID=A0A9D4J3Q9_DREPO|nr:hypothetical protein DPMN_152283 [Dreissena polymorpha]